MAQKRFNAKNGISVGGTGVAAPIDFIDETGQILSGARISFLTNPTITTDQPLFNANQTWNASATPFSAFRINVTDTASNVSSKLVDLQVGGISKFYVDKTGNAVIAGDLTVQGTTVTMNTSTVDVEDTNITLGKVTTPTNTTANGGGITLLGTTNKTIIWDSTNTNWTSSENLNIATGKVFKINNVSVLSNTTLGSSVVTSSLTSVGTIATGVWNGTVVAGQYGGTGVANTGKTITLGGNLTTSGAFATTFTVSGATNVTLPTSGTLATTSQLPTVNNATLTMNVSGVGLSGSQTFTSNQSSAATFTVTSNATSANTASTIVSRDASGNFSAGSIYATALNGTSIKLGTEYEQRFFRLGGGTDLGWKILATVVQGTSIYSATSFYVDVVDTRGNHAQFLYTQKSLPFKVTCVRSSGVLDNINAAYVSGPVNEYIRVSKTATGNYEIQGRTPANYDNIDIRIRVSYSSDGTVTYSDGTVAGDTLGTMYVPNNTYGSYYFTNIYATTLTGALTGNASTATTLQTARTIGGVSFNGSANINLPGVNVSGNQNTTGTSAGITGFNNPTTLATANTIAYRSGTGDITARLYRAEYANSATISGAIAYRVNNTTNNFIRYCSNTGAIRTYLGLGNVENTALSTWAGSSIGYGQTWQNVAASRAAGTTYYNTTGRPITVSASSGTSGSTGSTSYGYVNGLLVNREQIYAVRGTGSLTFIVPHNASYRVDMQYNAGKTWTELR